MARSHKPIVWGLFAAGGTVAAFVVPALILMISFGVPLGLISEQAFTYENLQAGLSHPLVRLIVFGMLSLILWHAAHRMRITAHDLGIRADLVVAVFFYAVAAAATLTLALALV